MTEYLLIERCICTFVVLVDSIQMHLQIKLLIARQECCFEPRFGNQITM